MKILSIADKEGSAIDRLAKMNLKRWTHAQVVHTCVHPKRPEQAQVDFVRQMAKQVDIIDFQYWKTAVTLRKLLPELEGKKMVLTHHNEHNIVGDQEWKQYQWDAHVVKNGWQYKQLVDQGINPVLIRHAIEFDCFSFTPVLNLEEPRAIHVGQIKKVKGVRELANACRDLKIGLTIVGKPSEAGYWEDFRKEYMDGDQSSWPGVTYLCDVPDDEIGKVYAASSVFVCNSDDGTESGTMPILEAMASGIPVVSRSIGLVRDVGKDAKNMIVRKGAYTDVEDLKAAIFSIISNKAFADELREAGWRSVRQYHPDIQAREYDRLFRRVMHGKDSKTVSIIMPTYNRAQALVEQFEALNNQTYKDFEVVVCDDGCTDNTYNVVREAIKLHSFPIRYVETGNKANEAGDKKYGLAHARNLGVIESIGSILVFCDDRLIMHPDAIGNFVKKLTTMSEDHKQKVWVWGSKGAFKSFVENFSATWRRTLIDGGMFNERIDEYGGMTQEVSNRFGAQGVKFDWCPESLAEPIIKTHSKAHNREAIIRSKIKLYKMGFQ